MTQPNELDENHYEGFPDDLVLDDFNAAQQALMDMGEHRTALEAYVGDPDMLNHRRDMVAQLRILHHLGNHEIAECMGISLRDVGNDLRYLQAAHPELEEALRLRESYSSEEKATLQEAVEEVIHLAAGTPITIQEVAEHALVLIGERLLTTRLYSRVARIMANLREEHPDIIPMSHHSPNAPDAHAVRALLESHPNITYLSAVEALIQAGHPPLTVQQYYTYKVR